MRSVPLMSMEKILYNLGASRISEEAKQELKRTVEKKAREISIKALELSGHAGRNTVMKKDVDLAIEKKVH